MQDADDSVTLATSEISPEGFFRFDLDGLPKTARFKLDSHWLWLPDREQSWGVDGYDGDEPYRLHAWLGKSVHGRVVLPPAVASSPDALKGALVRISPTNGRASEAVLGPVRDDGSFSFENLNPERAYEVRLEQDGFACIEQPVRGGAPGKVAEVELHALQAVRLRGHVFAQDGSALSGAMVMLSSSHLDVSWTENLVRLLYFDAPSLDEFGPAGLSALTGSDGSFALDRAPALDSNALFACAPGFRVATIQLEALRAGESRSGLQFLLAPHAEIEITAIDERGEPVSGARIAAFDPDSDSGVDMCYANSSARPIALPTGVRDSLLEWLEPPLPTTERGIASLRLMSDVKHVLLDVRDGDFVGFPPEPLLLEDGKKVKVTVTLRHSTPVCIEFPSMLRPGGEDDLRVFDELGWMRTGSLGRRFGGPNYPWNAASGERPVPNDTLPGIRLAPLPAGRYTVKGVDATGKVHTKTFDLDPEHPRSINLNQ
jgi:hypothetical protein